MLFYLCKTNDYKNQNKLNFVKQNLGTHREALVSL